MSALMPSGFFYAEWFLLCRVVSSMPSGFFYAEWFLSPQVAPFDVCMRLTVQFAYANFRRS
jgi:hypothetical protein